MSVCKIDLQDLLVFEGNSKKDGKPYSFVKLDRNLANNKTWVNQLKEAGVRVQNNAGQSEPEKAPAIEG